MSEEKKNDISMTPVQPAVLPITNQPNQGQNDDIVIASKN